MLLISRLMNRKTDHNDYSVISGVDMNWHNEGRDKYKYSNPLLLLSEEQVKDIGKHRIDSLEQWCRRLIDDKLRNKYGDDYINVELAPQCPLIKAEIKRRIEERRRKDPHRFPRWIDGIVMEDLEYFLCRDDLYRDIFKNVFANFYSGQLELRSVLERLTAIRNKLSHGSIISIHELEQVLCYTNDIINCCKEHYTMLGKEKEYNVPMITRIKDSLGNDFIRFNLNYYPWEERFDGGTRYDGGTGNRPNVVFRSGDEYKVWVEVDGSYEENSYDVNWKYEYGSHSKSGNGNCVTILFTDEMVSYRIKISFVLKTKKSWHKIAQDDCDDILVIYYEKILPPINSD